MSSNWNETFEDKTDPSKTYTIRPNTDFEGADLRRYDFTGGAFAFSNFQNADLRGCNFTLANMWNCDFRGADLRGANLTKAQMQRCNFTGAKIGDVYAYGADFSDSNFRRMEFGANNDFTKVKCHRTLFDEAVFVIEDPSVVGRFIETVKVNDADLSWAYFRKCDLTRFNMQYAKMHNTDFSNANLSGVDLSNWDIEGSRFVNANLRGITIDGAVYEYLTMDYADIQDSTITNSTIHSRIRMNGANCLRTNFTGTYFNKQSEFEGANMRFTNWTDANIRESMCRATDFSGSTFSNTGMREVQFQGANFQDCRLDGCNLRGSNFKTANFRGAVVTNSNTAGINANDSFWNETYLAGATFNGVDICGSFTWAEAIFEDRVSDNGGPEYTIRFTGANVTGPDCYLYYAVRELADPEIPLSNGHPTWPFEP